MSVSKFRENEAAKPIGVFDSGIGGLTVVKELNKLLPNERIIYFGDTGRVPYGNKSKETIIHYSLQISYFLMKKKIKILVAACNSVSSVSIPTLRKHFHIPVIGVIEPGVRAALKETRNFNIGVAGTLGTIASNSYRKAIKRIKPAAKVFQKSCSLFVQLAEDGWNNNKIAQSVSDEYLRDLRKNNIDTLVLGCTHYPILREVIQKSVGQHVKLIDSGKETAREVKILLEKKGLLKKQDTGRSSDSIFYVSDFPYKFKETSQRFLARELKHVKKVNL